MATTRPCTTYSTFLLPFGNSRIIELSECDDIDPQSFYSLLGIRGQGRSSPSFGWAFYSLLGIPHSQWVMPHDPSRQTFYSLLGIQREYKIEYPRFLERIFLLPFGNSEEDWWELIREEFSELSTPFWEFLMCR